jgi:hypothetical protein
VPSWQPIIFTITGSVTSTREEMGLLVFSDLGD